MMISEDVRVKKAFNLLAILRSKKIGFEVGRLNVIQEKMMFSVSSLSDMHLMIRSQK